MLLNKIIFAARLLRSMKSYLTGLILVIICVSCQTDSSVQNGTNSASDATQITPQETYPLGSNIEPGRLAWQKPEFVIGLLGDLEDKVVADIGAGAGYFAFRLLNRASSIIAIEINPEMITLMDEFSAHLDSTLQIKFETRLATPDDAMLKNAEVDVMLIINTIGYIEGRSNYLTNLRSSLKENGRIVIVDFKMKQLPENIAPDRSNRVILLDLQDELEAAGYQLIYTDDTSLDFQYIVIAEN